MSSVGRGVRSKRTRLKRPSPFPERLNTRRFVRAPRKMRNDSLPTNRRGTAATYLLQNLQYRLVNAFFTHTHSHTAAAGASLFNNLFFDHPSPPKPPCPLRGCKDHPAPHPSYSSIENGISMSDGVSNGKCKKEKKYIMLIIERVVRRPSLN